jgi:hypothetical protein
MSEMYRCGNCGFTTHEERQMVVHACSYYKPTPADEGREKLQKCLDAAMMALETVMNQPFNGSWDHQAAYVSGVLCSIKAELGGP